MEFNSLILLFSFIASVTSSKFSLKDSNSWFKLSISPIIPEARDWEDYYSS